MKRKSQQNSPNKTETNLEFFNDESENNATTINGNNGQSTPPQRRRQKRSSVNSNAFLSTVSSVHELMSFVIYKDRPPNWLKQTDLYREYQTKSSQNNVDPSSNETLPLYYQPTHRKQRSNLHVYAQNDEKAERRSKSPMKRNQSEVLTTFNSPIKQEKTVSTRKKVKSTDQNVENREPTPCQLDSSFSSSSVEHTSPSPTTTVSRSSSSRSSPVETMRTRRFSSARFASPTPKTEKNISSETRVHRRSTRIWSPSNFYLDSIWLTENAASPKRPNRRKQFSSNSPSRSTNSTRNRLSPSSRNSSSLKKIKSF